MRRLLLCLPLVVLACSSDPEWVSSGDGSLCTYDTVVRSMNPPAVDVVIIVDDSPEAAPSRPMLRAQTMAALRKLVTERVQGDPSSFDAAHDLHVEIRGASTSFERRLTYLAKTPDNAWITPKDEMRDPEAFLGACAESFDAMPTGNDETPILARIADLRRGDGFIRPKSSLVVFAATAHDDTSADAIVPALLGEVDGLRAYRTYFSVLVDVRARGSSAPVRPPTCGVIDPGFDRTWKNRAAIPRLAAAAGSAPFSEGRIVQACSENPDLTNADLFFQRLGSYLSLQCFPEVWARSSCTILVAPPVSGDDSMCARPELGLTPASAAARSHVARDPYVEAIAGRPLCQLREIDPSDSAAQGFYWGTGASTCSLTFTPWAKPVDGSYVFYHCESTRCGR